MLLLQSLVPSYGQEIVGGALSPDITKISPNTLIELKLDLPLPSKPTEPNVVSIDWTCLTIRNNFIESVKGYIDSNNSHFVFTGLPGNYLILSQVNINGKLSHVSTNIVIPGESKPEVVPIPEVKPIYAVMVADTSNPTYLQSPQAQIWASTTIKNSFANLNIKWKHYDVNSQVSDGKGNLIPLLSTPWGDAANKIITSGNTAALVVIGDKGNVILSIPLPNNEEEIIKNVKGNK